MASGIYKIENLANGRCYIGSAVNLPKRWREHVRGLSAGTHRNRYLQSAWHKYGPGAFTFSVLEEVADKSQLVAREQYHIDVFSALGKIYNLSPTAGSNLGLRRSPEIRAAMSVTSKNTYATRPELKAKMREASRNRTLSDEIRVRLGLSAKNRVWTEEMRAFVSEQFTGFVRSRESVERSAAKRRKPVICVETGETYKSLREAGEKTGLDWTNIGAVCRGKRKHTNNLTFKFC